MFVHWLKLHDVHRQVIILKWKFPSHFARTITPLVNREVSSVNGNYVKVRDQICLTKTSGVIVLKERVTSTITLVTNTVSWIRPLWGRTQVYIFRRYFICLDQLYLKSTAATGKFNQSRQSGSWLYSSIEHSAVDLKVKNPHTTLNSWCCKYSFAVRATHKCKFLFFFFYKYSIKYSCKIK